MQPYTYSLQKKRELEAKPAEENATGLSARTLAPVYAAITMITGLTHEPPITKGEKINKMKRNLMNFGTCR